MIHCHCHWHMLFSHDILTMATITISSFQNWIQARLLRFVFVLYGSKQNTAADVRNDNDDELPGTVYNVYIIYKSSFHHATHTGRSKGFEIFECHFDVLWCLCPSMTSFHHVGPIQRAGNDRIPRRSLPLWKCELPFGPTTILQPHREDVWRILCCHDCRCQKSALGSSQSHSFGKS